MPLAPGLLPRAPVLHHLLDHFLQAFKFTKHTGPARNGLVVLYFDIVNGLLGLARENLANFAVIYYRDIDVLTLFDEDIALTYFELANTTRASSLIALEEGACSDFGPAEVDWDDIDASEQAWMTQTEETWEKIQEIMEEGLTSA